MHQSPPAEDEVIEEWRTTERQQQTRLAPDQVDALIAAYLAGTPCKELAARFEVNESTVFAHLTRRRVERRPFRKLHDASLKRAKMLYASGSSLRSVATELGVSKETVRAGLVSAGVQLRSTGGARSMSVRSPR